MSTRSENGAMQSYGEGLAARYLDQRGWSWEYERLVGTRRLDFYVDYPAGSLAMEVYEPHVKLGVDGGWVDSYTPVRRMFEGRK